MGKQYLFLNAGENKLFGSLYLFIYLIVGYQEDQNRLKIVVWCIEVEGCFSHCEKGGGLRDASEKVTLYLTKCVSFGTLV